MLQFRHYNFGSPPKFYHCSRLQPLITDFFDLEWLRFDRSILKIWRMDNCGITRSEASIWFPMYWVGMKKGSHEASKSAPGLFDETGWDEITTDIDDNYVLRFISSRSSFWTWHVHMHLLNPNWSRRRSICKPKFFPKKKYTYSTQKSKTFDSELRKKWIRYQ